jgi:hypothetical protein
MDPSMVKKHHNVCAQQSSPGATTHPWGQQPMGVDVTPDIFQSTRGWTKMGDIELVQAYRDETLIITNGMLNKHMQQLETVLQKA